MSAARTFFITSHLLDGLDEVVIWVAQLLGIRNKEGPRESAALQNR
jgi:hypothetical protein